MGSRKIVLPSNGFKCMHASIQNTSVVQNTSDNERNGGGEREKHEGCKVRGQAKSNINLYKTIKFN